MVEQGAHRAVDDVPTGRREPDEDTPAVPRVRTSLDQPALDEPVHAGRHRAAGHERLGDELPGGEFVGVARPPQGREDVELPGVEIVLGEGGAPDAVVLLGDPRDAREHVERLDVEVGALPPPRRDDAVHVVAVPGRVVGLGCRARRLRTALGRHVDSLAAIKYLDVKIH